MTDALQIALIVSIAPTVAAIASLVVGLSNRKQIKQVHTLANSNLKRQTKLLQEANKKIEGLIKANK